MELCVYSDLHLHTIESKLSNEVFQWNGLKNSIIRLYKENIKIFSFSDHDIFNSNIYFESKDIIKSNKINMTVIPSIEVSIINSKGTISHAIFYFDDNLNDSKIEELEKLLSSIVNRNGIYILKIIKLLQLNNYKFSIIAHGGKINYLPLEDIISIKKYLYAIEANPSHSQLKKIKKNELVKDIKILLYSDTHVWNKYKNPKVKINYNDFISFIREEKNV